MTTPITDPRARGVCLYGKGAKCCAYLGLHPSADWCCMKGSELEETIRKRLAAGTIGAKGDNCPGPPFVAGEE